MWIDTQRTADQYSRIDDMNSSDAHATIAQTPCDFNGGEICTSVGTLHNISCAIDMWIDTQRACGSIILVLNERQIDSQGSMMYYCTCTIASYGATKLARLDIQPLAVRI
jgi:hypothetical protein